MAIVMTFVWPEITPEVYDAARTRVGWEENSPDGFVMHMGWFDGDGFHVADVWETEDHFTRFIADRVAPVVKGELGITTEPQVTFAPSTGASSPRMPAAPPDS